MLEIRPWIAAGIGLTVGAIYLKKGGPTRRCAPSATP
jgi:hypothetical protein